MKFNTAEHGYDPIAKIYNEKVAAQCFKNYLPAMEKLLLPHLDSEANLLDVGCGTGQLVKYLITKGYKVTGIDISEAMLNYARMNAPEAEFFMVSAVDLDFTSTFDGIVSTGALSHIMNIEEINRVAQNIYKALKKNGILFLNMFLEEMYQQYWSDNFYFEKNDDHVSITHTTHDAIEKIAKCNLTTFSLVEDRWKRLDMTFIDKIYTRNEIQLVLEKAGFKEIGIFDEKHDLKISEMAGSTYFVCHKM
ncbi:class I SAM-dependent methyltransferase [Nostoc sp. 2RC]|uniref:class I SAM-dependent methyltransferase n=1 Tax=Nostoc sp. 2RC TaxID=2485484 RepID=UPI00162A0F43|nr:class I SAM-dependent methyltransferase [Nostoc sp. 2RC]